MQLWLIVPVKPLSLGKSRLASLLSAQERRELARRLLLQTLKTVAAVEDLAGIIAISRDEEVLTLARAGGASTLPEAAIPTDPALPDPEAALNNALNQARTVAVERGADAILILPADLPLLTVHDIGEMIHLGNLHDRCIVLAGSRDGGTNALLLRPAYAIDFAYGPQSRQRHIERAKAADLTIHEIRSTALALDLDSAEDWFHWQTLIGENNLS